MTKWERKERLSYRGFLLSFAKFIRTLILGNAYERLLWGSSSEAKFHYGLCISFAFQIDFAYHSETYDLMKFYYDSTNFWFWFLPNLNRRVRINFWRTYYDLIQMTKIKVTGKFTFWELLQKKEKTKKEVK